MDKGGWLTVGMGNTIALIKALSGGGGSSGGSGVFTFDITIDADTGALVIGATWQEIKDAYDANRFCVGFVDSSSDNGYQKTAIYIMNVESDLSDPEQPMYLAVGMTTQELQFVTDSADGYPTFTQEGNGD